MLKTIAFSIVFVLLASTAVAQSQLFKPLPDPWAETYGEKGNDPDQSVSGLLSFPLGDFRQTHVSGVGVSYSRTGFRWDSLGKQTKRFSYLFRGGADYFFGKNVTTAGESFTFGGYFYFHAMGGVAYSPSKKFRLGLAAGPGLALYKGSSRFGGIGELSLVYYYQPEWSFGPSIVYRQQADDVDPLLAVGLRIKYHF